MPDIAEIDGEVVLLDGALRELEPHELATARRQIAGHVGYVVTKDTLEEPELRSGLLVVLDASNTPGATIDVQQIDGRPLPQGIEARGHFGPPGPRENVWTHLVQQMPHLSTMTVRPFEGEGFVFMNFNTDLKRVSLAASDERIIKDERIRDAARASVRLMPDEVRESPLGRDWADIARRSPEGVLLALAAGSDPGPPPDIGLFEKSLRAK